MRFLIAPDKFKGCLPAAEVARALADGILEAIPTASIDLCPLSDGGDGLVRVLYAASPAEGRALHMSRVVGPLPEMAVDAEWAMVQSPAGRTAVIEMAAASGLAMVPAGQRNPRRTTSYGTGQLLVEAARRGADSILLGIGGSATVDLGLGCCQAAGMTILPADGLPWDPSEPLIGQDLERVYAIKRGRGGPVDRVPIVVACDVTNPLCGTSGAAHVFGPQKGATPEDVAWFDAQHHRIATNCHALDAAATAGAGAAGGIGFALLAFFNASLKPGIDLVLDAIDFDRRAAASDVVITGEGSLDGQSAGGKTAYGVLVRCQRARRPVFGVGGRVEGEHSGFAGVVESSPRDLPLARAMEPATATANLRHAGRQIAALAAGPS